MAAALCLRADARALPLPDASVDLIVTSPPYHGLRSYTDGGEHYQGQIGSESTAGEWLAAMLDCTREMVRVMKPVGSLFVNLGDRYSGPARMERDRSGGWMRDQTVIAAGRPKSLLGLPWRYALACINQLGLILRAELIWSKPNGLPESVTDRVRRSHEQWFHFTVQPRYYAAVDEIREPHTGNAHGAGNGSSRRWAASTAGANHRALDTDPTEYNPLGKLPGSVWSIPSEPLTVPGHLGVDHFAAFPTEWPRRLILGWSPPGVCTACGEGRRPVGEVAYEPTQRTNGDDKWFGRMDDATRVRAIGGRAARTTTITGYTCACPEPTAPTRPAVILDPFGGTGTTALVASVLGRIGISVDMSGDYCRLAQWRTTNPQQRAAAMRVDRPPLISDDQLTLDLEGA